MRKDSKRMCRTIVLLIKLLFAGLRFVCLHHLGLPKLARGVGQITFEGRKFAFGKWLYYFCP